MQSAYGHLDEFRVLKGSELPQGVRWGARYKTFVINSPVYCAYLLRRFIVKGGWTREYTLAHPQEAFTLERNVKCVVNCSGTGFGHDPGAFIIRGITFYSSKLPTLARAPAPAYSTNNVPGQTCLVRNPCTVTLTRQNTDGTWSFCVPRPSHGGTIIGGTKQPHDWDPNPSLETRTELLEAAMKWFRFPPGSERKFDVIRDVVGRRPAREGGMRIEAEKIAGGRAVFHAYGAGGRGFELSRGVAEDVGLLMFEKGVLKERASL